MDESTSGTGDGAQRLWTYRELAERYGVHPDTVAKWVREGRLSARKIGPRPLVRVTDSDREAFERTSPCPAQ